VGCVNKAAHNAPLQLLLRNRSKGSVEFKHANISAVLTLHGCPYIDGYKPRFNFQALLEQVVLEYLDVHRDFFEPLVTGPLLNPTAAPDAHAVDVSRVVEAPPEAMRIPQTVWPRRRASVDSISLHETRQIVISDGAARSSSSSSSASDYMMVAAATSSSESNGRRRPGATAPVTTFSRSMRMAARD
jgi:hypothetical protein